MQKKCTHLSLLVFVSFLLLISNNSLLLGQENIPSKTFHWGFKAGAEINRLQNYNPFANQTMSVKETEMEHNGKAFNFGLFFRKDIYPFLHLQADLIYSRAFYNYKSQLFWNQIGIYDAPSVVWRHYVEYAEIPLTLSYNLAPNKIWQPSIFAGVMLQIPFYSNKPFYQKNEIQVDSQTSFEVLFLNDEWEEFSGFSKGLLVGLRTAFYYNEENALLLELRYVKMAKGMVERFPDSHSYAIGAMVGYQF